MGERKVLNRYFPPDFDPVLIPRRKWDPYKQVEVRMMIPFSLQCIKCGEFMYRGKKFNSRKEDIQDDQYHGIRKYRFYIKCCVCSNEIAFKTDPENADYICESGATRNYESWKQQASAESEFESERTEEADVNAMAALESKTLDSKIEMDILDALDEIKAFNEGHDKVASDELLKEHHRRLRKLTKDEEVELDGFKSAQLKARSVADVPKNLANAGSSSSDDQYPVKSLPPSTSSSMPPPPPPPPQTTTTKPPAPSTDVLSPAGSKKRPAAPPKVVIKRKLLASAGPATKKSTMPPPAPAPAPSKAGLLGLAAYSASESE